MTLDPAYWPLARHDDLVMTLSGADLLVYDQQSHHLHQLNSLSASVWRQCTGTHGVFDLARLASLDLSEQVSHDAVLLALRQLDEAGLLQTPLAPALADSRQNRRDLLRRAAITGTLAVPAIVSISAPHAAAAASGEPSVGMFFLPETGGCRVYVTWENFTATGLLSVSIYSGDGTVIGGGTTNALPQATLLTNNVLPNGGPDTVYAQISPPATFSIPMVPFC